jgi:hypothetical protein
VGRRGVTNLVNLRGRTHLISAWDAGTDAMTCRFCRCDRLWQLFPGNHHRQNTHTHLLYMLRWCMPHSPHLAAPDLGTILETHSSCRTDVKSVKAYQLRGQGSGYLTPVTRIFNIRQPASTGQSETTQLAQAIGHVVRPPNRVCPVPTSCDASKYAPATSSYHDPTCAPASKS